MASLNQRDPRRLPQVRHNFSQTRTPVYGVTGAPRIMYGKKKATLLPLTGRQFRQGGIFDLPIGNPSPSARLAELLDETGDASSESEDSPLSDAEPSEKTQSSSPARKFQASKAQIGAEKTGLRRQKPLAITAAELLAEQDQDLPSASPREVEYSPRVPPTDKSKSPNGQKRLSRDRRPAAKKRRYLPKANELRLVSNPDENNLNDPISSSAFGVLEHDSSDSFDSPPIEPRPRTSLSAIRRRLKTPTSGHKTCKDLRQRQKCISQTRMSSQLLGDGFDGEELTLSTSLSKRKSWRRKCQPQQAISSGLQALSLTTGPLPDVEFPPLMSQLKMESTPHSAQKPQPCEDGDAFYANKDSPAARVSPIAATRVKRAVSFNDQVRDMVTSQLSSFAAPRRTYDPSSSSEDESELEANDDRPDEDGAAESYVDQVDGSEGGDEEPRSSDEEQVGAIDIVQTRGESRREQNLSLSLRVDRSSDDVFVDQPKPNLGVSLDFRKSAGPGHTGRSLSSRRPHLMEVNETISDEYDPYQEDEMLLEETPYPGGKVLPRGRLPPSSPCHDLSVHAAQPSDTTARLRSILKNSTPQVPQSEHSRPESTALNTRRNSMAIAEESRYFSEAHDRLNSSPLSKPQAQRVIRKKSNNYSHHNNSHAVDVPFSGPTMIAETSPEQPDYSNYTDTSQLNVLKQTGEGTWTSSITAAAVAPKDLRSLTRSVSRGHGTLSQAVRRRTSLPFQSPTKILR